MKSKLHIFQYSIKSTAANWVDHNVYCNPDQAHEWNLIKPHFREAFGDKTDPMVFANTMFCLKLSNFDSKLYDYSAGVSKKLTLHNEKCTDRAEPLPATQEPLPAAHGLTPAQQVILQQALNRRGRQIHQDFCKEFFLAGLSQDYHTKVKNKGNLETLDKVVKFLYTELQNDAKSKLAALLPLAPLPPAPVGGVLTLKDEVASNTPHNGQRVGGGASQRF